MCLSLAAGGGVAGIVLLDDEPGRQSFISVRVGLDGFSIEPMPPVAQRPRTRSRRMSLPSPRSVRRKTALGGQTNWNAC